jgi:hypothetical protein
VGTESLFVGGLRKAELPDKTVHVDRVVCGLPDGGFGKGKMWRQGVFFWACAEVRFVFIIFVARSGFGI